LRKVGIDPPIARFVRVGQSGSCHFASETHVVELPAYRLQAGFDVAETLSIRQLREGHREKLISTGKTLHLVITAVTADTFLKLVGGQKIHQP
jgi:hypothetical protein